MLLTMLLLQAAAAQAAGKTRPDVRAPTAIVAAAPAGDWAPIAPSDLLVMDLAPDAAGRGRRVVIQLLPAPFSQGWVGNIRQLATAHWWDGTSINRVQDNYVVQWGDASEKKPLPAGLAVMPETQYTTTGALFERALAASVVRRNAQAKIWKDGTGGSAVGFIGRPPIADPYAGTSMTALGWPVGLGEDQAWPVHCYGMVGVGRDLPPNTGTGAELYTVIGHAPRQLDRNIALVGRVVEGIEHLSSLPRGTGELGFYKTAAERTPIVRVRIASDLPAAEQPRFEYLSTESASFAAYADARANRRDAFYIRPAGGADVCNVPVPVRRVR